MAAFHLNLSALSAVSLLVGVFLIYNTVSATVARRQIEVGILRAVGAGPWQIRALFLGEAALIGLIGGLLGIGVGMIASGAVTQAVSQTVSSLYVLTRVETVALEPWHFALAFAAGVGAAVAGAWVPAAEAAKIAPSTVLACGRRSVASKEKVAGWLLPGVVMLSAALVAGWCALTVAPPWVAFAGAFFVLAGASCFSPKLTAFISGAVAWISHSGPPVLRLAADNLGRSLRRNAVTVAALGAAVAMAVGLMVMIHSFRETLVAWVGKGIIADLFIAPVANETLGLVATVPRDARAWLAAQPGVRAVDAFREEWVRVTLPDGKTVETALAAVWGDYRGNLLFREGNEIEAMRRAFRGEAIVINESLARKYRVQLGQELAIHTPSGVRKLVVAGVYADYSRESGCVFIGGGEFEKWFNNSAPFSLAVFFEPGLSGAKEALESAFRKQFGIGTAIAVYSNRELRGRILAIFDQTFAVTYLLRTVAVIVAIAGIVLSFTALVVERRQETGVFRSLGASPLQVVALFVWEAVWLGVAASVLGIASGAALAVVLTSVVNPAFFGWTIPLQWPVGALAVFPLWIVASSSVAALLPTWRASRENIAESVRSE
jgi:putative ABC transport system permease protein